MLAERLDALLRRFGLHDGWVVAAPTFMTLPTTAGAMGRDLVSADPAASPA